MQSERTKSIEADAGLLAVPTIILTGMMFLSISMGFCMKPQVKPQDKESEDGKRNSNAIGTVLQDYRQAD